MTDKFLFIDRDGTLIHEPEDGQIDRIDKFCPKEGVFEGLRQLSQAGYRLVMVTNQDGLGSRFFPKRDFEHCHELLMRLFASQGIEFESVRICPHWEQDHCHCRKPNTALVHDYLINQVIDRTESYVIGDRVTDEQFADNMGVQALLLGEQGFGNWHDLTRYLLTKPRQVSISRQTKETGITLSLELDCPGEVSINTGIGFFDHMLEQLFKHMAVSAQVDAKGDLWTGDHHTVEDTAIVIGQALRQALGDKRGIERFGFVLPMDDSQAQVAVDLGGRAYCVFEANSGPCDLGGMSTEMVPHFFRSLADSLQATVHIHVRGENTHHQIEAAFKGLGRAFRQAVQRTGNELPTTKGIL